MPSTRKYIGGIFIGSLILCSFSFIQKSFINAPITASGFIVPLVIGGIVGFVITKMYLKIINLIEELKLQNCKLEEQVKKRTEELRAKNKLLKELSNEDSLTSLGNRRHFDHVISKECSRVARGKSDLSLIMCDIDNFKLFNDTHGHQAGDECLVKISAKLKSILLRDTDYIFRYGGEEFAIILPYTSYEAAISLAEKVRIAIENLQIEYSNGKKTNVTMSFGVFSIDSKTKFDNTNTISSFIEQADKNLYLAKTKGKNTVS